YLDSVWQLLHRAVGRCCWWFFFFFQAEDGIRDWSVTGVQTCALPISRLHMAPQRRRPALHDRAGGFPDMGGQRVQRLVGGKGVLEDRLERWSRRTASVLPFDSGFPPSAPRTGQVAFTTSSAPIPSTSAYS